MPVADSCRRAARDLVAAFLNVSCRINIGISTTQLIADWNDAVAGGDEGLDEFHRAVGALNDPTPGDQCPLPR